MTIALVKRTQRSWTSRARGGRTAPVLRERPARTDIERHARLTPPDGPTASNGHRCEGNWRQSMAPAKTSNEPQTIAAEANGAGASQASEVVTLDISDPTFMATAYDTYAALREQGRVGIVKFTAGEAGEQR